MQFEGKEGTASGTAPCFLALLTNYHIKNKERPPSPVTMSLSMDFFLSLYRIIFVVLLKVQVFVLRLKWEGFLRQKSDIQCLVNDQNKWSK